MSADHSLLRQVREACGELQADAVEMLAARRELAQLELRLAQARLTRLLIVVGVSSLVILAGFVLLVHVAAEEMPAIAGLTRMQSQALAGVVLLVAGLLAVWLAVRRFTHKYRHFERTQAELKADLLAVQQWFEFGRRDS